MRSFGCNSKGVLKQNAGVDIIGPCCPPSAASMVLQLHSSGLKGGPGVPAGKSNSGEGGEDPVRWEHLGDIDDEGNSPTLPHLKGLQIGDTANSRIKQVCRTV